MANRIRVTFEAEVPVGWAPLEPGLNLAATSLEAERLCDKWHLISRGVGDQWVSRTHYIFTRR